jgi:hypothetical protein
MKNREKNHQRTANICIALSGISVGFMHALYTVNPSSGYHLISFSLLIMGLPFLIVSWASYNYLHRVIAKSRPLRFSAKEVDKYSFVGIASTTIGISVFFLSWHTSLLIIFVISTAVAVWKSPAIQRSYEITTRAQRIRNFRKSGNS